MATKREIFKLIKFLGAGAFAQTHLAEVLDPKSRKEWGKAVVIKIPYDKEKEKVLIRELITNAGLHLNLKKARSKNVVPYLDFATFDDRYVMVMEYVEGKPLRSILGPVGSQEPLDLEDALNISEQVCEGLIEIHKFHILHRDIKPENILISKKERTAMIMDLGISRFLSSSELASTTTGTIYYMSKELLESEGGSFYSDIYSLGVTMYEMLTGQLPFTGDSYVEIIDGIRLKDPEPPMKLNSDIDERLNKIILKAINKDLNKRYKTADDLLRTIKVYRQGIDEEDEYIEKALFEAQELFQLDRIKDAEKALINLTKKYSNNPKGYLGLGEFYNRCQRYRDAIKTFKRGIEFDKEFALFYRNIALSLSATSEQKEAINSLKKALELGLDSSLKKHAITLLEMWERS